MSRVLILDSFEANVHEIMLHLVKIENWRKRTLRVQSNHFRASLEAVDPIPYTKAERQYGMLSSWIT